MTKRIYIVGAVLVPVALVLFFTGPRILSYVALGAASGCVSFALFLDPAIIARNVRFESPAAKRATAYLVAALMGLIALLVALASVLLVMG